MRRRLRALRALSPRDAGLLVEAWIALLGADVGLRLWGLRRVQAWAAAGCLTRPRLGEDGAWDRIKSVQRWVGAAAHRHLLPMTCLRRGLATQWLLGRRGIRTELRFGVRRDAGRLAAHAWLEYRGMPVGEAEAVEERFALLVAQGESRTGAAP